MTSILAIALISVRNAIRSKIVIVLLAFLLVGLIGLPLTLKGDGTLEGHVRILLRYTLGLATLILSIATVWASCAALSTEIRGKQIQLIISKPVKAWQIWLGKWAGLTAMNAAFLALCLVSTYGALRWTTQPHRLTEDEREQLRTELLVAQRHIAPRPRDLQEQIMREYQAGRTRGEWLADAHTSEILPHVERRVRAQANAVPTGSFNRWVFDLPETPSADRPLILRYRFTLSILDFEPVRGTWTVGSPGAPHRAITDIEEVPRTWHTLSIPVELIEADGTVTIEFANIAERPITVLFNPDDGMRLRVYAGGFAMNYLRAALLILFHLAFLAAIGVTAGAFFTIPVAALSSFYLLLILNAGRFIGRIAERDATIAHGPHAGWFQHLIDAASFTVYRGIYAVIRPIHAANPLELVTAGQFIAWSDVGYMFAVKVVAYSGLLLIFGAWHLARKEVALPS